MKNKESIFPKRHHRHFEKVSLNQFLKDMQSFLGEDADTLNLNKIYSEIKLPSRGTNNSAGYDFFSPIGFRLPPGKTIKIPTGIKVYVEDNEFLSIHVRSSTGFKFNVNLLNSTGVIDGDYVDNIDNEGHIWMGFKNHGEKEWFVNIGDAFGQGIFMKYETVFNDCSQNKQRIGGIGSTDTI